MKKIKEKLIENDLGVYLYELRSQREYTIEELVEKIGIESVNAKKIRKWEHDLDFPNLEQMYRLSDIYEVPVEWMMQVRTKTLEEGLKGVPKEFIRLLSYLLGFSLYGMIILSYIIIFVTLIGAVLFFIESTNKLQQNFGIYE